MFARWLRVAASGILLSGLLGCSVTRESFDECEDNLDCRAAFGPGFVCGEAGFCSQAAAPARCNDPFPSDLLSAPDKYRDAIIFGSLLDRSVSTHVAREEASKLATRQLIDKGGLEGQSIGFMHCDIAEDGGYDTLSRTEAAVSMARYLTGSLGASGLAGPAASSDTLAVFEAVGRQGTLMISPSATSPELTGVDAESPTDDSPGLLWRTAAPDTLQARVMAEFLRLSTTPSVSSVYLIHETGAYGDGLKDEFSSVFEGLGGSVEAVAFSSETERDEQATKAHLTSQQWVVFISSQTTDVSAFLNAASTLSGFETKQILLTDSAANATLLQDTRPASALYPRVFGTRKSTAAGPVYDLFRASFTAEFKKDPSDFSFVAEMYDATWLLFLGTAWAQGQGRPATGLELARGLRRITSTGTPIQLIPDQWVTLRDQLGANQPVNITGASGNLDFDPATEETSSSIDVWKINAQGNGFDVIETQSPR